MTVFRDNREPNPAAVDAAQLAATARLTGSSAVSVASPSLSNEQSLADSINELKSNDVEYARLQSDEAREQWVNIARANLERQRSQDSNLAEGERLRLAQQDATDASNNSQLFRYAEEVANRLRQNYPNGYTMESLPTQTLADIVRINQQWQQAAELAGVQAPDGGVIPITWNPSQAQPSQQPENKSETFPDGQLYQMTENGDGTVEVRLATGERFVGDPLTVTKKIAEAKVHTTRWAHDLKKQIGQPGSNGTPASGEVSDFGVWAADEQARALGFSDRNELMQWGNNINQTISKTNEFMEQQKLRTTTADFMRRCPDFPGTPQAIEALGTMIEAHGWDTTPDNMEAAHAHLVRTHVYAPLSPAEQNQTWANNMQADSRQQMKPPPMLRSSSPDATQTAPDIYKEPLDQMRARLIRQQLESSHGSSLEYR